MSEFAVLIQGLISLLVFLMALIFIDRMIHGSKTYKHRKDLVNMYVSAKVRKIAKAEGIDIEEEYNSFIQKNSRKEDMDDVIEQTILEEIDAEAEKQSKKIKKDK